MKTRIKRTPQVLMRVMILVMLLLLHLSTCFRLEQLRRPGFIITRHQRRRRLLYEPWLPANRRVRNHQEPYATLFGVAGSDRDSTKYDKSTSSHPFDLNLVIVDHYDSFTYNLVDLVAQYNSKSPRVAAWDALEAIAQDYDGIILSPGPGAPSDYPATLALFQQQLEQLQHDNIPILGVCLGHQIMGLAYNATVVPAPESIHGRVWECRVLSPNDATTTTTPSRLFHNVSDCFFATRYHSLQVVLDKDDSELRPTAVAVDANDKLEVIMAMESTTRPHYGVQFHPESIGSLESVGRTLMQNFLGVCRDYQKQQRQQRLQQDLVDDDVPRQFTIEPTAASVDATDSPPFKPTVYIHKLQDCSLTPEEVMLLLYRDEPFSFWLDHASAIGQEQQYQNKDDDDNNDSNQRAVSILGASRERVEYWNGDGLNGTCPQQRYIMEYKGGDCGNMEQETVRRLDNFGILEYMSGHYSVDSRTDTVTMVKLATGDSDEPILTAESEQESGLPFDFRGGHVGYLGYEVRFDTLRYLQLAEGYHGESDESPFPTKGNPNVPTAAFLFASNSCVYHHATHMWYLVSVARDEQETADAVEWTRATAKRLATHRNSFETKIGLTEAYTRGKEDRPPNTAVTFVPSRSRETYLSDFRKCMEYIRSGESYELCLTNQLEATIKTNALTLPLHLYQILRRSNPAPHAAFFDWNSRQSIAESQGSVAICCSSPERFVSVRRRTDGIFMVETKPIKGTRARVMPSRGQARSTNEAREDDRRAAELRLSVKDRAENLMIVDLLRNDISRVCASSTVHVSKMMAIESYATVHQMVSTIRGILDPSTSTAVDLLKACFPGGSMTGAPKVRSMELLNELEARTSRGPYSGCLGYISVSGCADMNIIIRSAVISPQAHNETRISVGAGGAITALSDDIDEYDEMKLKASAVIHAVEDWVASPCSSVY